MRFLDLAGISGPMGVVVISAATLAVTLGVALTLVACAPTMDQPEVAAVVHDLAADLDALTALLEEVRQADMSSDIDGLLACSTEDVVSMPPNLPAIVGKSALRAYYEEAFSQLSIEDLEMTPEEMHVAGDWAFSWGRFEETILPAGGGDPVEVIGKYLFIFRREADGSWKLARLIGNMDGPLPEM